MAAKKHSAPRHTAWWQSLFDLVTKSALSDAKAFIQSAEEQIKSFIRTTITRSILLLLGLFGLMLMLTGVSRLLDGLFDTPGSGNLLIGSVVVILSFAIFSLTGNQGRK
jgi:hypothetical protein